MEEEEIIIKVYHADLMVSSVWADSGVVGVIYDNEKFHEGISVFWN